MRARASVSLLFAVVAGLLLAGPAGAVIYDASVDASSGSTPSNRSLTGIEVTYDSDAGSITTKARFLADPSTGSEAALLTYIGTIVNTPEGERCRLPQALVMARLQPGGLVQSGRSDNPGVVDSAGTITFDGRYATTQATHEMFKNLPFICVQALVQGPATADEPGGAALAVTDGWVRLVARPAPEPPATPSPAPPIAPPVTPPAPAPQLSVSVTGVPETVKKNRWISAKVRVENIGTAPASGIKLKVLRRKGVSSSASTIKLKGSIKPGARSKLIKLRFKLGKKAGEDTTVRLRATGKSNLKAEGEVALVTAKGKPAPLGSKGSLKGRYFWGTKTHVDYVWDNYAVYFASEKWAYWGFVEDGGLPTNCKSAAPKLDKNGQPTDEGCHPVSIDKAGNVKIGPLTGTWKNGELVIDEVKLTEAQIPKPGSRFEAGLEHRGFRGLCGLITGCTTWHYSLALTNAGTFVKANSSLSSFGDGWSTPAIYAGSYPPDKYGTYQVLKDGLLELAFADGSIKRYPFAILTKDGKPDPVGEGVLVGDTNYYPDPTP